MDSFSSNVLGDINLILLNMPKELSDMEKLRYIYINMGKCFSYDYRVIDDATIVNREIDYSSDYVGRYQTCVQISELLANAIKVIGNGVEAKVVDRILQNDNRYGTNHKAVEVSFPDGYKYLLDLTLDLYEIQSGCKTKNFGFASDASGQYDIISLRECEQMDKKMGLIKGGKYTDYYIDEVVNEINNTDFSSFDDTDRRSYIIKTINEKLDINFYGFYEKRLFLTSIFNKVFRNETYGEYNLINSDHQMSVCYIFDVDNKSSIADKDMFIYSGNTNITKTNYLNIMNMLNTIWKTNSRTLNSIFDIDELENDSNKKL